MVILFLDPLFFSKLKKGLELQRYGQEIFPFFFCYFILVDFWLFTNLFVLHGGASRLTLLILGKVNSCYINFLVILNFKLDIQIFAYTICMSKPNQAGKTFCSQ